MSLLVSSFKIAGSDTDQATGANANSIVSTERGIILTKQASAVVVDKLTVLDDTEGAEYSFTVNGNAISYTVLAAATTSTVATAIAALIDALAGITSTAASEVISVVVTAGGAATFSGIDTDLLTLVPYAAAVNDLYFYPESCITYMKFPGASAAEVAAFQAKLNS